MSISSAKKEICASNVWLCCGLCPVKNLSSIPLQGKTNKWTKKQRGFKEEFRNPVRSRMLLHSLYQALS